MVKALFDTNILVDYLNAVPQARTELGTSSDLETATRGFLSGFRILDVDEKVAERAVSLRRNHRIKLPDAVIWATAQVHALLLVTRNVKDFPERDPGVRAPYRL